MNHDIDYARANAAALLDLEQILEEEGKEVPFELKSAIARALSDLDKERMRSNAS